MASFLEHFWEQFWGPFWDQIGQRGGKMSPREPSGASKSQKAAFSKTLKNLQFFSVFGSRGFPREPQEAREGSQETPKETPKGVQNLVKKWLKSEPKNAQIKDNIYAKISLRPVVMVAVFWGHGAF